MLTLARAAIYVSRVRTFPKSRSFAEVVNTRNTSTPQNPLARERIQVKEDHGLYAFFRRKEGKEDENLVGDARYEVVETPEKMAKVTGRAWKASELRLKSFRDLHTLWYVLLRERNLLATQKEETRRMGVTNTGTQVSLDRVHQCRRSMGRIKAVINERRLAYEGAVRLVEGEREAEENSRVRQYLQTAQRVERKYMQRRRIYEARRSHQPAAETHASSTSEVKAFEATTTLDIPSKEHVIITEVK